jgi:hypothetical protein
MGSIEGSIDSAILVPPVAGPVLFAPARFAGSCLNPLHPHDPNVACERVLTRPAYVQPDLARALREGPDPNDTRLVMPMPCYALDDTSVAALSACLLQLSSAPAPGVAPDALHLATIVTPDASPGHSDAVLGVRRAWSQFARGAGKPWQLHVWGYRVHQKPGCHSWRNVIVSNVHHEHFMVFMGQRLKIRQANRSLPGNTSPQKQAETA